MPTDKEGIERALRTLPSLPFPLDEERCGAPAVRETAVSGVYRIDLFPRLSGVDAENRCRLYAASPQRAREVFSGEVLAMGREEGALWFVTIHSAFAAEYELCRYRQRTASGRERARLEREAMACALLGAKDESGYFGEWTPPERTPDGGRARYRQADRGVWFVEGAEPGSSLSCGRCCDVWRTRRWIWPARTRTPRPPAPSGAWRRARRPSIISCTMKTGRGCGRGSHRGRTSSTPSGAHVLPLPAKGRPLRGA